MQGRQVRSEEARGHEAVRPRRDRGCRDHRHRRRRSAAALEACQCGVAASLRWRQGSGLRTRPSQFPTDELKAPLYWKDERLSGGATPTSFGANNSGKGVGGSMLHWGAYAPRATERNIRLKTYDGVAVDWPMSLDDLWPYYEWLESFLGVSGPAKYPWDPGRTYPLAPLPLNSSAIYMAVGCEGLGIRVAHAPIAAVSQAYTRPEYGTRNGCVNRGYCHQGCRNGAKATMDVTFLPAALAAGAEIRAESYVHGVERDAAGAITAVVYTDAEGHQHRQRCRTVFLCAGGVESPRQLLHWGIANSSDQVGRNFMAHISTQVWATMRADTRPYKGFPASLITEDFMQSPQGEYAGGYLLQSYGILPVAWAEQVVAGRNLVGQALVDYLLQYDNVAGIGMNGDTLPTQENRLTLSDERDEHGLAKPLITFALGDNEYRMSDHGEDKMRPHPDGRRWQGPVELATHGAHHRHLPHGYRCGRLGGRPLRQELGRAEPVDCRQLGLSDFAGSEPGAYHHGALAADRRPVPLCLSDPGWGPRAACQGGNPVTSRSPTLPAVPDVAEGLTRLLVLGQWTESHSALPGTSLEWIGVGQRPRRTYPSLHAILSELRKRRLLWLERSPVRPRRAAAHPATHSRAS